MHRTAKTAKLVSQPIPLAFLTFLLILSSGTSVNEQSQDCFSPCSDSNCFTLADISDTDRQRQLSPSHSLDTCMCTALNVPNPCGSSTSDHIRRRTQHIKLPIAPPGSLFLRRGRKCIATWSPCHRPPSFSQHVIC